MRRPNAFANPQLGALLVAFLSIAQLAKTVKHENFKTCTQSGFCKRNRALADRATAAGAAWASPYELDADTVSLKDGVLTGTILKNVGEGESVELPLVFSFLENGVARVTIDEAKRQKGDIELRHGSKARKERYNETAKWALVGGENMHKEAIVMTKDGTTSVAYGSEGYQVEITHKPFSVRFIRDGEAHVVLNERSFMNVEHWRPKTETEGEEKSEDEQTWWEETFGGNTDSKPRGTTQAFQYEANDQRLNCVKALNLLLWTLRSPVMTTSTGFQSMPPVYHSRKLVVVKATIKNRTASIMQMSSSTRQTLP